MLIKLRFLKIHARKKKSTFSKKKYMFRDFKKISKCTLKKKYIPRNGFKNTGTQVPGPGLEVQYAILLISFVSSFASLGKVFLQEEENTDGWIPRICRYTSYRQCYLKPQRQQQ